MDLKNALAPTLQFAHAAAADLTGLPFLTITEDEARALSKAAQDIFALYDMEVSPAVAAWLSFVGACSMVYGPKVVQYGQYKKWRADQLAQTSSAAEQTLQ